MYCTIKKSLYLFYLATFFLTSCTIIGDAPTALSLSRVELINIGSFTSGVSGRTQIIRDLNDESRSLYLEFSPEFDLMMTSGNFTVQLSSMTVPTLVIDSLKALSGKQNYLISLPTGRTITDYDEVEIVNLGTMMTVTNAALSGLPMGDTTIFNGTVVNIAHMTSGPVEIVVTPTGNYKVNFLAGFAIVDFPPGPYMYLTKENGHPDIGNGDIELGLANGGVQSFNVPQYTNIFFYPYVLVHCKPFDAPLGRAQLQSVP